MPETESQVKSKMPDNLTCLISQVLNDHELVEDDPTYWRCACTVLSDSLRPGYVLHNDHVADAVIAALGLERQDHYDPCCDHYRYVTDWIAPND